ncbi:MAG TPA: phosphoglycerate dehydrogenase, partial [Kofleriaceae bacterium]
MAETSFPKSSIKVLLLENIHPVAKEAFVAEGFQVEALKSALPEAELAQKVKDVHLLGIRSKTQITPKVLDEA